MSESTRPCPQCGNPVAEGTKFCGACGYSFIAAPNASARPPVAQKTMLGTGADFGLGPAAPASDAATDANAALDSNRTILGMPATPMPSSTGASPSTPAASQPSSSPPRAIEPNTNRTMLGMPLNALPGSPDASAPPSGAPAKAHLDPQTNRTMLGVMNAQSPGNYGGPPAAVPMQPTRTRNEAGYDDMNSSQQEEGNAQQKKGKAGLFIGLGLLLLALIGGAALVIMNMKPKHGPIQVSIVRVATGDALQVDVPGVENRTKLRFSGQEMLLASGRATFPIETEALHVGDNTLQFTLVAPDGETSQETVHLAVDYRVRADVQAVDAAVPAIDVIVDAHPGAQVVLDGTALALDARGHGVRRLPLNTALVAAGVIEVNSRYAITNNAGAPNAEGTLTSRIAVTTLQIERPGRVLTVERPEIEIAGLAESGATIKIDGVDVPLTEGRFTYRLTLSDMGNRTISVVARARGKAPQTFNIQVHRVSSLAEEASRFGVDRSLTYARIFPNPNGFVGQKVEMVGRVFNVSHGGGQSVIQMLVDACPPNERCQLWVTYPATTDVALNSSIRVIGTVGGEQQYRSQSGRANTAPRVDAAFILPVRPAGTRDR